MSIRLHLTLLTLLASVSSLSLLFGGVAQGIRSLGKGLLTAATEEISSQSELLQQLLCFFILAYASPTNTLTTLRGSTYECA